MNFFSLFSQHDYYRRLSFQTISAVGAHAAMAHYVPTPDSDRQITRQEMYLIDSGTQYKGKYRNGQVGNFQHCSSITASILSLSHFVCTWIDGTTDITRTVHFGEPCDKEKDAFTRVLKGFISVATAVFPPGAPVNGFILWFRKQQYFRIIFFSLYLVFILRCNGQTSTLGRWIGLWSCYGPWCWCLSECSRISTVDIQ